MYLQTYVARIPIKIVNTFAGKISLSTDTCCIIATWATVAVVVRGVY